ncbi:MAG: hypothetical protein E7277_02505 [Lachnospiraceae bacterium]|nr:hypothetical protein [Lachnospiraceae bacterium]
MKKIILSMLFIVLLVGCAPQTKESSVEEMLQNTQGDTSVELRAITPFVWEKVYFIAPYVDKKTIETSIGVTDSNIKENMVYEDVFELQSNKAVFQVEDMDGEKLYILQQ